MEVHFYTVKNLRVTGCYITLDHKKFWAINDPHNFMYGVNNLKANFGWLKDDTVNKHFSTISSKTHPELFI